MRTRCMELLSTSAPQEWENNASPSRKLVAKPISAVLAHLGFDELEDEYAKAGVAGTVREVVGW